MTPTAEQQACCDALAGAVPGDTIAVHAFAGTGKTTTLQLMSQVAERGQRILYLAYNRALADEGRRKFGPAVECRTTHSLALRNGRRWDFLGDIRPNMVAGELRLKHAPAAITVATLKNFFASDYPEIDIRCLPEYPDSPKLQALAKANGDEFVAQAKKLWELCQQNSQTVPMPHDGYLKLFQLAKKRLPYDIILFDEAQDANPATLDIIKRQLGAVKVFVGDPHQQIYGFRGSVNAMANLDPRYSLNLTTSFRFDETVAEMAMSVLRRHKQADVTIKGMGGFRGDGTEAGMCRTNAAVFKRALEYYDLAMSFGFIGTHPKDYVSDAMDVFRLRCGQLDYIRKDHIAAFETYGALESYIEETEDMELTTLVNAVNKLNTNLPRICDEILANANPNANAKVGTGHASKGLEFDSVEMDDDFAAFAENCAEIEHRKAVAAGLRAAGEPPALEDYTLPEEEANLLYVSLTRARTEPSMNEALYRLIFGKKRAGSN